MLFSENNEMGYINSKTGTDATVNEIYLASINNLETYRLGSIIKREYLLECHTQNSLKMAFFLITKSAINLYAKNYADGNWYLEVVGDKNLIQELREKLQHYFIEVYEM
jgi:hypothetical protein